MEYRYRSYGYTLLELMISLLLSVIVMGGVLTSYSSSSASYAEAQKNSRRNEDGRHALGKLRADLAHAGFYGEFYDETLGGPSLADPCSTNKSVIEAAMSFPVQGYNIGTVSSSPISCLTTSDLVDDSDIVVVRRASTLALQSGETPVVNEVYLQSNSNVAEIQLGVATGFALGSLNADNTVNTVGTDAEGNAATILVKSNNASASTSIQTMRISAEIRKFHVHVYFVAPCAEPNGGGDNCTGVLDDNGAPIPTLKRLELTEDGGSTVMKIVPIARGVERIQIDYGLDSSDENTVGSGVPNSYLSAPTVSEWEDVVSAKVYLLMRNTEPTTNYVDIKRFSLGLFGFTTATSDSYKRKVYTSTIRLSNLASRREVPL